MVIGAGRRRLHRQWENDHRASISVTISRANVGAPPAHGPTAFGRDIRWIRPGLECNAIGVQLHRSVRRQGQKRCQEPFIDDGEAFG